MESTDIFRLILPLLIISIMLFGVLWLVRRYSAPGKGRQNSKISISVVSTFQLMPKKFLSLVKVEDKIFLLGISEHSINLIKELDIDQENLESISEGRENNNFVDFFKSALKNR